MAGSKEVHLFESLGPSSERNDLLQMLVDLLDQMTVHQLTFYEFTWHKESQRRQLDVKFQPANSVRPPSSRLLINAPVPVGSWVTLFEISSY